MHRVKFGMRIRYNANEITHNMLAECHENYLMSDSIV